MGLEDSLRDEDHLGRRYGQDISRNNHRTMDRIHVWITSPRALLSHAIARNRTRVTMRSETHKGFVNCERREARSDPV